MHKVNDATGRLLSLALSLALCSSAFALEGPPQPTIRGTLQNATTTNNNGTVLNAQSADFGFALVTYVVSGTFVATVNFEGTQDQNTFVALSCYPVAGGAAVSIATAPGSWRCNLGGAFTQVRARVSGYTSGAVTVTAVTAYLGMARNGETPLNGLVGATVATPTGFPHVDNQAFSIRPLANTDFPIITPNVGGTGQNFSAGTGWFYFSNGVATLLNSAACNFETSQYATFQAAVTAVGATVTDLCVDNISSVTANVTVPSTLTVRFVEGGQLSIANLVIVTWNGHLVPVERTLLAGAGAANTVFGSTSGVSEVHARWVGAVGDGVTDDSAALQSAVTVAAASNRLNVLLGAGVFKVATSVTLSAPTTIIGVLFSPEQSGSPNPASVVKWTGAAACPFSVGSSFVNFENFAIQNFGTGICAIDFTVQAGRTHLYRMSWIVPSTPTGASPFSVASVRFQAGADYTFIDRCEAGSSPFLKWAGTGTTVYIARCVFDAGSVGSVPWFTVDATIKLLEFRKNTFNFQTATDVVFDNSATTGAINLLRMVGNEFEGNGLTVTTSKIAKLKNVKLFEFVDNALDNFSSAASELIELTNSTAIIGRIQGSSIAAALVKTLDTVSYVLPEGISSLNSTNTKGIIGSTSQSALLIAQTSPNLNGQLIPVNSVGNFAITVSTNATLAIFVLTTASNPSGIMEVGQVFWVTIINTSAGALTGITFTASQFKMSAPTMPAAGFRRTWKFQWDGAVAHEVRTDVDIAN